MSSSYPYQIQSSEPQTIDLPKNQPNTFDLECCYRTAKTPLFFCLTISLRKPVHRNCFFFLGGVLLTNWKLIMLCPPLFYSWFTFWPKPPTDTLAHSNIFQLLSDSNQCVSWWSLMLRCYPTLTYIHSLATLSGHCQTHITSTGLDPVLPSELP